MEELIYRLKQWQANSFVLYSTSHGFHWNVEGALFTQYHSFFKEIYEDVFASMDTIAEWQRKLQSPAPFTLNQLIELNTYGNIPTEYTSPLVMSEALLLMVEKMIEDVKVLFDTASANKEEALANFCAERQDKLQFWAWQLRSSIKSTIN
jgi:starvation-inducible DNA-binding protein